MTMNGLRVQVEEIIDQCMLKGEAGWPPHSGGNSIIAPGKKPRHVFAIFRKPRRMPTPI